MQTHAVGKKGCVKMQMGKVGSPTLFLIRNGMCKYNGIITISWQRSSPVQSVFVLVLITPAAQTS